MSAYEAIAASKVTPDVRVPATTPTVTDVKTTVAESVTAEFKQATEVAEDHCVVMHTSLATAAEDVKS
jgi:hypothetical protein